jgi:tripartite-type tricarboxylate transporter receptor subunit TctC
VTTTRRRAAAAMGLLALAPGAAAAQRATAAEAAFPVRPVRLIVPFPAGGAGDVLSRTVAEGLRPLWGQPVVVENVSGAGGNVGAAAFARAEPDGHTLLSSPPGPIAINAALYRQLAYDPLGFAPVTVLAKVPNVVAVNAELGLRGVRDLVEMARSRPDAVAYASQGIGSTSHLTAAMFEALVGARMVHVPYRGEAPALTDLAGGRVQAMFGNLTAALPLHQAGRLRILAVADEGRSALLPEVPTAEEAGLPGFRSTAWFAVVAPAGTPAPLAERIAATIAEALRAPALRDRFRELGAEPVGGPPAETAAFFAEERRRWSAVIREAKVTLD